MQSNPQHEKTIHTKFRKGHVGSATARKVRASIQTARLLLAAADLQCEAARADVAEVIRHSNAPYAVRELILARASQAIREGE